MFSLHLGKDGIKLESRKLISALIPKFRTQKDEEKIFTKN
jgi:hypothetical protein